MKSNVSVEELNAATILLTGIPVSQLVEVHIAGSTVTAVSADEGGRLNVHRVLIGSTPAETVAGDEVVDAEIVGESPEESDEDDGS